MSYLCPNCQSTSLEVTVQMWAALHQDGENFETDTDEATEHDQEWDADSPMRCQACGYYAKTFRFEYKREPEPEISREEAHASAWLADNDEYDHETDQREAS